MTVEKLDHKVQAKSRIITEYRESTNLINYINTILNQSQDLEDAFYDLLINRWLDTAEGAQLDILGRILGQPRTVIGADSVLYFGFDTSVNSGTFGDENNPATGARFRSADEETVGTVVFADPEYRIILKGRALSNRTNCSWYELCDIGFEIFDMVVDFQEAFGSTKDVTVRFYGTLDTIQKTIAGLVLPKPAGVSYTYEDDTGIFVPGT